MGAFDVGRERNEQELKQIIDSSRPVRISAYFSQGWELFKQNPGNFIGFLVLFSLISAAASFVPLGSLVVSGPLTAGFYIFAFKMLRRQTTEFGDFFKGFNFLLPLVISGVLVGIFTVVGIILLIIPGIYLSVAYMFVTMLIIDKDMHFWQAMETSRKIISKNWFAFFGLVLLAALLNLAGALLLLVGLLVTIPWTFCIFAAAYADVVGLESEAAEVEVSS